MLTDSTLETFTHFIHILENGAIIGKKEEALLLFLNICENAAFSTNRLKPLPKPFVQIGPTCGYIALSHCISFWNKKNPKQYFFHPAKNKKESKTSLYQQAKDFRKNTKNARLGFIGDMENFNIILKKTNYQSFLTHFKTLEQMNTQLQFLIDHQSPCIIAIDVNTNTYLPHQNKGKNAHYITIVGYVKSEKEEIEGYIYITYNNFVYANAKSIFESSKNLEMTDKRSWVKDPHQGWIREAIFLKKHAQINIDLSQFPTYKMEESSVEALNGKIAVIHPTK